MDCFECEVCKNYIFQGGGCYGKSKKCSGFQEEPRGRKIRTKLKIDISHDGTDLVLRHGAHITIAENNKETEIEIIKINYVDLENMWVGIDAYYFERDMPEYEKRKRFRVIEGVRRK